MDMYPFLYIIPFFIYLYWIFFLVKDDFILLRKNISADQIFSLSIVGIFVLFLFARGGFVLMAHKVIYANPLVFFAFPYYPGFSQASGIMGIYVHVLLYTKRRKIPFPRTFDIIVFALIQALWVGMFLDFLVLFIRHSRHFEFLISGCSLAVLALSISWAYTKNIFRDGSLGYLSLSAVCLILLLSLILSRLFFPHQHIFLVEQVLFVLLCVGFLVLFVKNEYKKGRN